MKNTYHHTPNLRQKSLLSFLLLLITNFLVVISTYGQAPFITTWKTDNPGSFNKSIIIPTEGSGYNYDVDWDNDGVYDDFGITGDITHYYDEIGTYTIRITGDFPRIFFNHEGDKEKIISIDQWGDIAWTNMSNAFAGTSNLIYNATDVPNLTNVTEMPSMFRDASNFDGDLSGWDVSGIINMSRMFNGTAFDHNINNWVVDDVEDMSLLFANTPFNQPLNLWNVGKVTNMADMFRNTTAFNQPLGSWQTGLVTNMARMFRNAAAFNQPLNSWNVEKVTDMNEMFSVAVVFDQDLNLWNVGMVNNMYRMFNVATNFNGEVGAWTTSNVTNMEDMFHSASNFNKDLPWDVGMVEDMTGMFWDAAAFNGDISNWNVENVIDMRFMFYHCAAFNQNISNWNVAKVTNMASLFNGASDFDQNLGGWDIGMVVTMHDMLWQCGMSVANYDSSLIGWESQEVTGIELRASGLQFCEAIEERSSLINIFGWSIVDSGGDDNCYNDNDLCNGALMIPVQSESCTSKQLGEILYSTNSGQEPIPDCANYNNARDVWFKLIVPASGVVVIETSEANYNSSSSTITNTGLAAYSANNDVDCDGGLTEIACDDNSGDSFFSAITIIDESKAGDIIFIRVWGFGGFQGGIFDICAYEPLPPGNNLCSGAYNLDVGELECVEEIEGNNYFASNSSSIVPACGNYNGSDVWYKVKVPGTGKVTVEISSTASFNIVDTGMEIYTGTGSGGSGCGQLTAIACDDNSGAEFLSLITINDLAYANEDLYVRVWSVNNLQQGTFNICAFEGTPPPANNTCEGATSISVGSGSCTAAIEDDNTLATDSGQGSSPACGNYQGADLWYMVTVPASGNLIVDLTDLTISPFMQFYNSDNNDCIGTAIMNTCNTGSIELDQADGLADEIIFIRVWEAGNDAFGDFEICAYEPINAPDNDICSTPIVIECGETYFGSTGNATGGDIPTGGGSNACGGDTPNSPGLWYSFIGTGNDITLDLCTAGTDYDADISVFTYTNSTTLDCEEGLECLAGLDGVSTCSWRPTLSFSSVAGTHYLVYVNGFQNGSIHAVGDFEMSVSCSAGNPCPDPENLSILEVTTETAKLEWESGGSCSVGAEYWVRPTTYSFPPPSDPLPGSGTSILCSATYNVDLADLDHATDYEVFAMEYCADGNQSEVLYLGLFSTIPINDNACDALNLNDIIGNGPQSDIDFNGKNYHFSNLNAGVELGEPTPTAGPCDGQNSWCTTVLVGSAWFSFMAPPSGNIDIAVTGTFFDNDLKIALWEDDVCLGANINPAAVMVAANDNYTPSDINPRINSGQCLIPGRIYYLQVGAADKLFLGTFDITLTDPGTTCPVAPMGLSCGTPAMAMSTGMGEWIHLYENNKVVASINDMGNNLGNIAIEANTTTTTRFYPNGSPYLNRNWKITVDNNLPALVRFYLTPAELAALGISGNDEQQIQELNLTKVTGGNCEDYQSGGEVIPNINYQLVFDGTNHMVQYPVNSFSSFYLNAGAGPLPVELFDFTANAERNQVILKWQTASETNNEGFHISHSKDGRQWDNIGFVKGKGESNTLQSYQFVDSQPVSGLNYYRLVQLDFDGRQSLSEIRTIEFSNKPKDLFHLFPNPNQGTFFLSSNQMNEGQPLTISIFNPLGRVVLQQQFNWNSSAYELKLPVALENGVYYLRIQQDHQSDYEIRMIVLRD